MSISVLLVDDHPMFRKGLRLLLEEEPDMSVVGEASDGKEALEQVRALSPDVVVMDITMPNLNGIEATRQILSNSRHTKVVALSIHASKGFVKDMLAAGASGYILKDSVPEELINGVRKVMRNEAYLSSAIIDVVVSGFLRDDVEVHTSGTLNEYTPDNFDKTLFSKIHRPAVDSNQVRRPQLLERLDQGLQRPLILVAAPAGYGKTMLVSSWLEASSITSAWISLDKSDNDLRLFLSYFLSALQNMFPDAVRESIAMATALTLAPVSELARSLINELGLIEKPFILALDDFQHITHKPVLDLLNQLLRHQPRAMHLVLISRRDPPLSISNLRASKHLMEIRTHDLRFNKRETAAFLRQELGGEVDASTAAVLEKKTEGWVTGLRLAALSMRHRGHFHPQRLGTQLNAQYVMEYLFNDVFSHQPPQITQYLLATALLERFSGPLCEAMCAPTDDSSTGTTRGWDFIAWLKKENMFLIPLDAENRWFRFHHLFKQLLCNQLERHGSREEINALHARASVWFAENGMIEKAIEHALAGGNPAAAAQLIAKHGFDLLNHEQWTRLERWLRKLPGGMVDRDAELLVLMSWLHTIYARYDGMAYCLDKAEALSSTQTIAEPIQGHLDALCGFQQYLEIDGAHALSRIRRACKKIPRPHRWARTYSFLLKALVHQMLGDRAKLISTVEQMMQDPDLSGGKQGFFQATPCLIYWVDADLTNLLQTAAQSLKLREDRREFQTMANCCYYLGIAHYHRNDLSTAEENLVAVVKKPYAQNALDFVDSAMALALIHQARNQPDQANQVGEAVASFALDANNPALLQVARSFQAELAFQQGRLGKALHWLEMNEPHPLLPTYRFYVPQLTAVKILLAQDTTGHRRQAADLLNQLHGFFVSIHNVPVQIDVLALKALLFNAQKDELSADKALTEALALAEPGGFIRPFVDLGPSMADLLRRLVKQNIAVGHIGWILDAFRSDESSQARRESDDLTTPPPPLSTQPLVDPLTNREEQILNLLAQRLSNKEIAAKLFISPQTVKKHLNNIYGKLTVSSRRQAVEKARQLKII